MEGVVWEAGLERKLPNLCDRPPADGEGGDVLPSGSRPDCDCPRVRQVAGRGRGANRIRYVDKGKREGLTGEVFGGGLGAGFS